jgi:hypothetical protein
LEALLRRLPLIHPKKEQIKKDLDKRRSGYRGELQLDYYTDILDLEKGEYEIYRDLRLEVGGIFFQIDILILTKRYALLIEGKNHGGELSFDRFQMVQTIGNERKAYTDPRTQAQRHIYLLRKWMKLHQLPDLPFSYLIAMTNEYALIQGNFDVEKTVIHCSKLISRIAEINQFHRNEVISLRELKMFKKLLLKKHTPQRIDILKNYQISPNELLTGALCPHCFHKPRLYYKRNKWYCTYCKLCYSHALREALEDYFYLYKPTITNSEFRHFFQIPSEDITQKLLQSQNLERIGFKKTCYYQQKHLTKTPK